MCWERRRGRCVGNGGGGVDAFGMEEASVRLEGVPRSAGRVDMTLKYNNNNGYFQTPILKSSKRFTRS